MSRTLVYLVGAGPGDPELITLKAKRCLEESSCIIYDALVDPSLLSLARPEAEKIFVGKRAGKHSLTQEEINRLLVEKAREHGIVCRLKGGDPFVFGRGGEEALHLVEHGIPFEVVPGVSSATAAPAYAGIPVTHRQLASSFAVVTGHEDPGKEESSIRWEHLATGVDTLVFLMGKANLEEIVSQLIGHGRPPSTPAAVIRWGTTSEQRTIVAPLDQIPEKAAGVTPPVAIVVGDVVSLRERLRWFDARPLFGKTVLVTRARAQASELAELLRAYGAKPVEAPCLRIAEPEDYEALDRAIANLECGRGRRPAPTVGAGTSKTRRGGEARPYNWVIFTSANGVEAFLRRLEFHGLDVRALHGQRLGAIGPKTAQALQRRGLRVEVIPEEFTSEGLIQALAPLGLGGSPPGKWALPRQAGPREYARERATRLPGCRPGERVLILRALEARDVLPKALAETGAEVDEVPAYRVVPDEGGMEQARELLNRGEVDAITFMSSGTVKNFLNAATGKDWLNVERRPCIACIGPVTADTAHENGLPVDVVAPQATMESLVEALAEYFGGTRGEG